MAVCGKIANFAIEFCGHVQAIRFCKLKSGKLRRRKNGKLFERVRTITYMVWIPLSYFLFYGFYQSLTYKKVMMEGIHTILFYLVNHYELVRFAEVSYL